MASNVFSQDSFTEASNVALGSHTGEAGATWTKHPDSAYSANVFNVDAATDRIWQDGTTAYYESGVPASADYWAEADFHVLSLIAINVGVYVRFDTSANTGYGLRLNNGASWELRKIVAGSQSTLASSTSNLPSIGTPKRARIYVQGSSVWAEIEGGTTIGPVTDTDITAAGRAVVRGSSAASSSTGYHLDNFQSASINTSVVATGVSATGSAGNLAVARFLPLTGNQAAASAGMVSIGFTVSLSGVSGSLAVGSVTSGLSVSLSGNQSAADIGILTVEIAILLTSQTATGEAGTINVSTTIPLTGNQAQATVGLLTAEGENNVTVALTGASASAAVGTLTPSLTRDVSGVQSEAAAGDVSVSNSRELASLQAAGQVGSVGPKTSKQISGVEISPQVGSVTGAVTIPVTGTVAASVAGVLGVSVDKALTGVHATGSAGTLRLRNLQALPEDVTQIETVDKVLRVARSSATLFATSD